MKLPTPNILTIWCVYVGNKYPIDYVYRLQKMVDKHLSLPYEFICLTDRDDIPGVSSFKTMDGFSDDPEKLWWNKLVLFAFATGPSIYFDLDTVIVDDIAALEPYTKNTLSMPKNWGISGHGGWQSSVMCWNGDCREPFLKYRKEHVKQFWGDQEFITHIMGDEVTPINPDLVLSYKYHCRQGLPKGAVAVTFHGKPDYCEVNDAWVKHFAFTLTPSWPTKQNLPTTSV